MADLSSDYCGLTLANPFIASASPLTAELTSVKQLQQKGAAAVILPSLFEESVARSGSVLNEYADKIKSYKDALDIPVIASLNGTTDGGWLGHATALEARSPLATLQENPLWCHRAGRAPAEPRLDAEGRGAGGRVPPGGTLKITEISIFFENFSNGL